MSSVTAWRLLRAPPSPLITCSSFTASPSPLITCSSFTASPSPLITLPDEEEACGGGEGVGEGGNEVATVDADIHKDVEHLPQGAACSMQHAAEISSSSSTQHAACSSCPQSCRAPATRSSVQQQLAAETSSSSSMQHSARVHKVVAFSSCPQSCRAPATHAALSLSLSYDIHRPLSSVSVSLR